MTNGVVIVDYGSGNIRSMSRGLETAGGRVDLATDPGRIASADRLVLPGVGAFGKAMQQLAERGLVDAIRAFVKTGRPFLGICVGMQMMLEYSEEFGRHEGLAMIPGKVTSIPATDGEGRPHPVPHVGWDGLAQASASWDGTILGGAPPDAPVYFVHSFHAEPDRDEHVLAVCDYNGRTITAAIAHENLTGVQFHPEKSGPIGLGILRTFLERS